MRERVGREKGLNSPKGQSVNSCRAWASQQHNTQPPKKDDLTILLPLCEEHLKQCKQDYIITTGSRLSFYNRGEEALK